MIQNRAEKSPRPFDNAAMNWPALMPTIRSQFAQSRAILREFGISAATMAPLKSQPLGREAYGRKILFHSDESEIMLATWAPGAECAPHDHGNSIGVVWVLEGQFFEQGYVMKRDLEKIGRPRVWNADDLIDVENGDIHSMGTPTGGMTLHLYSPRIEKMKVFDLANRCSIVVSENCGAWIPESTTQIMDRQSW